MQKGTLDYSLGAAFRAVEQTQRDKLRYNGEYRIKDCVETKSRIMCFCGNVSEHQEINFCNCLSESREKGVLLPPVGQIVKVTSDLCLSVIM